MYIISIIILEEQNRSTRFLFCFVLFFNFNLRVCVCVCVHVRFIIPASISVEMKFYTSLSRLQD